METIRKILTGKDNMLQIVLPDEYNNKRVELIILPAEEETAKVEEKKVDYSKYYGALKSRLSVDEIDKQLRELRSGWDRDPS